MYYKNMPNVMNTRFCLPFGGYLAAFRPNRTLSSFTRENKFKYFLGLTSPVLLDRKSMPGLSGVIRHANPVAT